MAHAKCLLISLQILFQIVCLISSISADKVPVFIWGKNSFSNLLPSTSAMESISSKDFVQTYLKYFENSGQPLVVFVQDSLSLEDVNRKPTPYANLKVNLEDEPSIVLSSVEDPVKAVESFKPQTISWSDLNAKALEKILEDKPKLLLVLLPPTVGSVNRKKTLLENDKVMEDLSASFGTFFNKMFTGKSSSWDYNAEHESRQRVARQLQQSDPIVADPSNSTFLNISSNLFWYSKKIALQSNNSGSYSGLYQISTTTSPDVTNITNTSMSVNIPFQCVNDTTKSISLTLEIKRQPGSWWGVHALILQLGSTDSIPMKIKDVGASDGFSYSCGKVALKAMNSSTPEGNTVLTLEKFQLEFMPKMRSRFSDSFHCSTFFTIPLWMGFFVVLLFTVILAMGVYLLFEVKTMDRFDDPKGKTISVPQTD